jgi:amino acid permease
MPKNSLNGGWGFTLFAMVFSFFVTYYCVIKLVEARDKIPDGPSYSEICNVAMGKKGKYVVDVFIFIM